MLNKAKICVGSVGFRIFKKFKRTKQTAEVFTSPSPNSFYESESHRHESKSESSKSGLESESDSSLSNSANNRLEIFYVQNLNLLINACTVQQHFFFQHSQHFFKLRWPSGRSVRLWKSRIGFDSESGQTNDIKIGIHSFPAIHSALKGQCGEQAGKFTCCAVGKGA